MPCCPPFIVNYVLILLNYQVVFSKQAVKDAKKLRAAGLSKKAKDLVEIVAKNPFGYSPSYEPLLGQLAGLYSRRINRKHRFVYEVLNEVVQEPEDTDVYEGSVKVLNMWTHYEQ